MKNLIKKLIKNKTFVVFFLFFAITFPTAIYQKSEFEKQAIMTSIGIDKKDDKYEFCALMVVEESPNKISSNVKLVSGKGENISEAVYKLSVSLGKEIGLAHCDSIVIGKGLDDDNLVEVLDYFVRSTNLAKNTNLVYCPGEAKELLQTNTENKDENGITFSKLVSTGSDYLALSEMNIEEFYARYFTKSPVAWVTIVKVEEQDNGSSLNSSQGGESSGGDSEQGGSEGGGGSGGTQSGNSQPEKIIKCKGDFALYNKGKKVAEFSGDEANVFNILNPYTKHGFMLLENVEDNGELKRNLGVSIVQKKIDVNYKFDGDVAVLNINLKLLVSLQEMQSARESIKDLDATKTHISDTIKTAINNKLQENLAKIVAKAYSANSDLFAINDRLFKFKNKEYLKKVSAIEQQNNFIENSVVNLNVKVEAKL